MADGQPENSAPVAPSVPAVESPAVQIPAVESAPVAEQQSADNFEQVREAQTLEVGGKVEELKSSGESLAGNIEKSGASVEESEDFKAGEEKIEKEADGARDEYEDSFITPGIIESKINENDSLQGSIENSKKPSEEAILSGHCHGCGRETDMKKSFCIHCGGGISETDRIKEGARQEIPNLEDKSKTISKDYYKRTTEELKKEFPEAIVNIEGLAKNIGFENLYIKDFESPNVIGGRNTDNIHVEPNNYGKDAVFFPKRYLKNHQLLEELDKERTNVGLGVVLEHEKEHCEDYAKKAANIGTPIETKEEYRDHIGRVAKEVNLDTDETRKQIEALSKRNIKLIESQVNTQLMVKGTREVDYKDKKEMVNELVEILASTGVYLDGLESGIDGFKEDLKSKNSDTANNFYENHYRGLSKKIIKDIISRERQIKQLYVDKYNEKYGLVSKD